MYLLSAPKKLDDYCKYQGWCEHFMGDYLACTDNKCVCRNEFIGNDTFNGCIECKLTYICKNKCELFRELKCCPKIKKFSK